MIHDTHSPISSFVVSWLTGVGRFSILVWGAWGCANLSIDRSIAGAFGGGGGGHKPFSKLLEGGGWPLLPPPPPHTHTLLLRLCG